jgi:GT2 family glycosyltransferase/nucleoside-diphosphate-sugar epimerase
MNKVATPGIDGKMSEFQAAFGPLPDLFSVLTPKSISVVIVSYNSSALLVECVQSVLASSWPVEVIVSDNGSSDGSIEAVEDMAEADGRVQVLQNRRNLGFAAANNAALGLASGELVLFLNPDCIVRPDTLERMVAALVAHPSAGMAGCLICNPDGSTEPACCRLMPTPRRLARQLFGLAAGEVASVSSVEAISGAFMLVRRQVLERIGSFDPGYFMHWEDLDLCLRCRQAGYDVLFVPEVEVVHYHGRSSRRRPLRVEWYKHAGLLRFWRLHYLQGWRLPLLLPAAVAIACRFLSRIPAASRSTVELGSSPAAADDRAEVWVFGATSLVGRTLLPRLLAAGYRVRAFCTDPMTAGATGSPHLDWHPLDLGNPGNLPVGRPGTLIHLAPLPLLPAWLDTLAAAGITGLIAFGSTSRFTKADSAEPAERLLAADLAAAEDRVAASCRRLGIKWAVFRPTMIYTLWHDGNITLIARFVRRFGFLPLPGAGSGRRQPVHADDLAKACIALLDSANSWNRAYNLSGGETLSYRAMAEAVFRRLGRRPRIIGLALPVWRPLLVLIRLIPRYRMINLEMVNRVNADMCFDHDEATQEFGFAPRAFRP